MENKDVRWKQRFANYKQALLTIEEVVPRYSILSELEKDGLIQRFEFTFDLAWKVMQDYLKHAGYNDIKGPRASLTQMAQNNIIDAFIWEKLLTARNELSHVYNEDKSRVTQIILLTIFSLHFRISGNKWKPCYDHLYNQ